VTRITEDARPQTAPLSAPCAAEPRGRLVWLDVAKGLGILWIVLFHAEISVGRLAQIHALSTSIWSGALDAFFRLGIQGVTVFVAASGFSLTYAAMRHGKATIAPGDYAGWLGRRLWQLLPIYWFAHVVVFAVYVVGRHPLVPAGIGCWAASFFGVNGWVPGWFGGVRGAWWFEGLILQLSILYPLMAWALSRMSLTRFLVLAWVVTIASRFVCVKYLYSWNEYLQYGVFSGCRVFEFAIGMAAAKYLWGRQRPLRPWVIATLGAAALAGYLVPTIPNTWMGPYVLMPTLLSASLCVLAWIAASALARVRYLSGAVAWCGVMTYPIFLMHGMGSEWQLGKLSNSGVEFGALLAIVLLVTGVLEGYVFKRAWDICVGSAERIAQRVRGFVKYRRQVEEKAQTER
jgi:peptidoglycan/LPS O-acetylase OafA/YrhL